MIRRWSRVISLNNNFNANSYFFKIYKINTFKNSVNFKKFTFKFTKFKRRALIRIKHRANFLIYTNILKNWITDFLFFKNYSKYQFFNKIFINNSIFYNFNFIKNRSENLFYNFNFIFYTFTKKNYLYFYNNSLKTLYSSPLTVAFFDKQFVDNTSIIPLYSSWDLSWYTDFNKKNDFSVQTFLNHFHELILLKNLEIRKILIFLFYFNINNLKKLNIFVFKIIRIKKKVLYVTCFKKFLLFL